MEANTNRPELIETFDSDNFSLYGRWRMQVDGRSVEVGCVIGVPERDRHDAKASGSGNRPFLAAWYADSSDWSTSEDRDAAIKIMSEHVEELAVEHGVA